MSGPVDKSNENKMRDFRHSLPMELMKAREAAMARFRPMLRDHGLTEQQWRVIRALAAYDRIDASELAARSFLLAPSLTRILQHLERKKIIRRIVDRSDQRRAFLTLTDRGKRIFAKVAPDSEALYRRIESSFGVENLEALYSLLSDFYTTLNETNDDDAKKPYAEKKQTESA